MFFFFFNFSEQFYVDTIFAMFFRALGFILFVFVRFWLLLTSTFGIKKKYLSFYYYSCHSAIKHFYVSSAFFTYVIYKISHLLNTGYQKEYDYFKSSR